MTKIPEQALQLHMADGLGIAVKQSLCYQLAGSMLVADTTIDMLENFRITCPKATNVYKRGFDTPDKNGSLSEQQPGNHSRSLATASITRATGWLADETRDVVNTANEQVFSLDITGIGQFTIDRLTGHIRCLALNSELQTARAEEATLGPPVALALALRDVWCLHASAICFEGRASLFLGPSGHGKSTLAGYIDRQIGQRTGRVADDISPCSIGSNGAIMLPHFPQPKLGEAQYSLESPDHLPVKSILILEREDKDNEPWLEPVTSVRAMRELTNQTVAVSLFDRELHRRHLHFLAGLVKSASVLKLHYPHDYDKLPQVTALLSDYL